MRVIDSELLRWHFELHKKGAAGRARTRAHAHAPRRPRRRARVRDRGRPFTIHVDKETPRAPGGRAASCTSCGSGSYVVDGAAGVASGASPGTPPAYPSEGTSEG